MHFEKQLKCRYLSRVHHINRERRVWIRIPVSSRARRYFSWDICRQDCSSRVYLRTNPCFARSLFVSDLGLVWHSTFRHWSRAVTIERGSCGRCAKSGHYSVFIMRTLFNTSTRGWNTTNLAISVSDSNIFARRLKTKCWFSCWFQFFKKTCVTIAGPVVPSLFILMEFANGGNVADLIAERIKAGSCLDEDEEIWPFLIDIALGIRHLHRAGIIHRYLDASTLFFTFVTTCMSGIFSRSIFVAVLQRFKTRKFALAHGAGRARRKLNVDRHGRCVFRWKKAQAGWRFPSASSHHRFWPVGKRAALPSGTAFWYCTLFASTCDCNARLHI